MLSVAAELKRGTGGDVKGEKNTMKQGGVKEQMVTPAFLTKSQFNTKSSIQKKRWKDSKKGKER